MAPEWLWGKTLAVWDLETDYIPTTTIFCNGVSIVSISDKGDITIDSPSKVYTAYWTPYTNGSLMEAISIINKCDYAVAHNGIGFDHGEVVKHLGATITAKPLDTMIISKIMFSKDQLMAMDPGLGVDSALWGRFSLKAWGQRLNDFKIDYEDFSHLNETMADYCNQDVDLCAKLLINLLERENFPLEAVVDIEHKAAAIIADQTAAGFYIDIDRTRELNTKLLTEKGELARQLAEIFSPKFLRDNAPKQYAKPSKVKKYLPNPNFKGW